VLRHSIFVAQPAREKFRHYIGRSPQAEIRRVQMARVKSC